MHYGHSIKYRYYFDGIFNFNGKARKQRDSVVLSFVNISGMNIEKIFEILRNI